MCQAFEGEQNYMRMRVDEVRAAGRQAAVLGLPISVCNETLFREEWIQGWTWYNEELERTAPVQLAFDF